MPNATLKEASIWNAERGAVRISATERRVGMFIGIAILLAILWVIFFFAVHVTGFFIHILIILAVISLIAHLFTGRRA